VAVERVRGFTIVELLVVVAVVALLASVVTPAAHGALRRAQAERSRMRMAEVAQAVLAYRCVYGVYPEWCAGGEGEVRLNACLDEVLASLCGPDSHWVAGRLAASAERLNPSGATFLRLDRESLRGGDGGLELVDAFGRAEVCLRLDVNGDGQLGGDELAGLEWLCGAGPINGTVLVYVGSEEDSAGGRKVVVWL